MNWKNAKSWLNDNWLAIFQILWNISPLIVAATVGAILSGAPDGVFTNFEKTMIGLGVIILGTVTFNNIIHTVRELAA